MAEEAAEGTWKALRKSLSEARLPVHGQWNVRARNGTWGKESLTRAEMQAILARQTLEDTVLKKAKPQKLLATAHAFWHDLSRRAGETDGRVPIVYRVGLHSASRHGLNVQLWSYQQLHDVPDGVTLRQAEELMPYKEFESLLSIGTHIAHLADILRLRALSAEGGGWFCDLDTWFVGDPMKINSGTGHVFGSMAAKPRTSGDGRYWRTKYWRQPNERAYISVPFHFPKNSKVLAELVQWVNGLVSKSMTANLEYNCIMTKTAELVIHNGLSFEAQDVHVFSPLAPWQD